MFISIIQNLLTTAEKFNENQLGPYPKNNTKQSKQQEPKFLNNVSQTTLILVTASSTMFFLGRFLRRRESSSTSTEPRKARRNTAAGAAYTPEYGPAQPHPPYGTHRLTSSNAALSHNPTVFDLFCTYIFIDTCTLVHLYFCESEFRDIFVKKSRTIYSDINVFCRPNDLKPK